MAWQNTYCHGVRVSTPKFADTTLCMPAKATVEATHRKSNSAVYKSFGHASESYSKCCMVPKGTQPLLRIKMLCMRDTVNVCGSNTRRHCTVPGGTQQSTFTEPDCACHQGHAESIALCAMVLSTLHSEIQNADHALHCASMVLTFQRKACKHCAAP